MIRTIICTIMAISLAGSAFARESLQGPTELIGWNREKAQEGYTLFAAKGTSYLIDMEGQVVHTWPIGTTPQLLNSGNLLDASKDDPSGFGGFRELDWEGRVVWQYNESREGYAPHHDWVRIFNKKLGRETMLYIANRSISHAQAIAAGCDPRRGPYSGAQMDAIVEIDLQGNIIWEWWFFDHIVQDLNPTKANYVGEGRTVADYPHRININLPGRPLKRDWLHCNSLDYNAELGQIVINSVQGEFYVIDHDGTFIAGDPEASIRLAAGPKGDFLYRFGDPARYEQGDRPAILEDWTQSTSGHKQIGGSHDVQWIDPGLPGEGNFLIFNNGQFLFERTPQSYILEIDGMRDAKGNHTDQYINPPDAGYFRWTHPSRDSHKTPRLVSNQVVWMYYSRSNQALFSQIGSGAQRLPNGNTLICAMTEGHFVEVTPDGDCVWEYINPITNTGVVRELTDAFPMSNAVFRAYRYTKDHPALKGRILAPKGTITKLAERGILPKSRMSPMDPQRDNHRRLEPRREEQPAGPQRKPAEDTQGPFQFTEGPVVDSAGNVFFTDVRANRIYRRSSQGEVSLVMEQTDGANGLAIDRDGILLLCQGSAGRVVRLERDRTLTVLAERYNGSRLNQPNDLWVAPNGGIYFTDPVYGRKLSQDGEHVYYIRPKTGELIRVADDLVRPNGLAGTADGKTLFITDHGGGKTWSYAIQEHGTLTNKKLFADIGGDGLALDRQGNLYLAAARGIVILDSQGHPVREISVPEAPTNVCLIENETKLFVTARTSIHVIPLEDERRPISLSPKGRPTEDGSRQPWLLVHAGELDANGNRSLSRAELTRGANMAFSAADINHDGRLSEEEYNPPSGQLPRHTMGGYLHTHSTELDANGDTHITREELKIHLDTIFTKIDTDHNGAIPVETGGQSR